MKTFLQIIKWVAAISAGLLSLIFIGLMGYRTYLNNSTKIASANGISSLEEITLGGVKQWIFIRGTDRKNAVLIFLHGGPGEPALGMSSSRKLDAELIKHYTVVHWDQRGAGKSYHSSIPVSSMTFDRWVEDCNELIDYTRDRFDTQKVFLVGHSAGTLLGIKTAYKYPEKVHAYVGVAQIIDNYEQQKISYDFVVEEAERAGDVKTLNAIKAIGLPPYDTPDKEHEKARYIVRYGGFIREDPIKQMAFIMLSYLTSPEYSLAEAFDTINGKGLDFTMNARYEEINTTDLTEEIQSIKVPIYFFVGQYDMITPAVQVEKFFNGLDAEQGKTLIMFEDSAHLPIIEEKEKYQDLLVNVVLSESQDE